MSCQLSSGDKAVGESPWLYHESEDESAPESSCVDLQPVGGKADAIFQRPPP